LTDAVCLISAPVSTDFEDPEVARSRQVRATVRAPKLGVLTLAGALESAGLPVRLFDVDEAYTSYLADGREWGVEEFPPWVAPRILAPGGRLFGFSSICSSYPLTIRIAECVKRLDPGCTILLGGPQASVVDLATLRAFPFVDCILRGEADRSLLAFLDCWQGDRRFSEVEGLTWRSPFGPQRNADAPVIENLDDLPMPAYHLSKDLRDAEFSFLELGRGCPFACTFCSTNDFFRRKFRVKSPQRMLADMRHMAAAYGFRGFNLIHDMFTVDRRKVVAFCEALIEAREGFNWSCSARTDCIDESLLELMARAGCDGIFFGIESGSRRMQRIIDKDLDPVQSRRMVEKAEQLGMITDVSVIAGFPEENEDDLRETLDVYMHAMSQPNAVPQLNVLAPLAGTPIHSRFQDQMTLEDLGSSLAYLGRSQSHADRALVREHPEIFPNFYLLPVPALDRPSLQELAEFLPMCRDRLRWLLVALYQRRSGILDVFRAWRAHRAAVHPHLGGGKLREYYSTNASRLEFVRFLRERMAEFGTEAAEALVTYEEALEQAVASAAPRPVGTSVTGRMYKRDIPVVAPGVHVVELAWDLQEVIESLQRHTAAPSAGTRRYFRTAQLAPDASGLVEVTPLIGAAFRLCNGLYTVEQFCARAGPWFECLDELRAYAARRLLVHLRRKGLIEIVRPAVVQKPADDRTDGASRKAHAQ
jgi:hypothetical protein